MTKQRKHTLLFLGFLLLAGVCHSMTRTGYMLIDTLMNSVSSMLYLGLLLFWLISVQQRLLISSARTTIVWIVRLMIAWLLTRIVVYDYNAGTLLERYLIYAYWTPQMLIPALFLLLSLQIRQGHAGKRRRNPALVLIPGAVFALLAWTSDLHRLIYRPTVPLASFHVKTGTYGYGPLFWIMMLWMGLAAATGVVLLLRESGKRSAKTIRRLLGIVGLWIALALLTLLVLDRLPIPIKFYGMPEINIFCMLGFLEICIRGRLIPCYENYAGFFSRLQSPALITDLALHPAFAAARTPEADREALEQALRAPLPLTEDLTLTGRAVSGGYAFWVVDQSAVHRAQEQLSEANALLEQENDLIRAETEQREKDAYLRSRHRIYHEIAQALYPCQKRLSRLLEAARPGTTAFRDQIALICVLNAYVKRKTNLLLLAAEQEHISARELFLALQESARYLTLAGLQTTVAEAAERQFAPAQAVGLYDAFEALAEQLLGRASAMMVSWKPAGLCLAAQTDAAPSLEAIALPVQLRRAEGALYMDIFSEAGGAEA